MYARHRPAHNKLCMLQVRIKLEQALQRARTSVEERNFLIVAHERSEATLAAHALDLTSRLDTTLASHAVLDAR